MLAVTRQQQPQSNHRKLRLQATTNYYRLEHQRSTIQLTLRIRPSSAIQTNTPDTEEEFYRLKLKNWVKKYPMLPMHRLLAEQFPFVDPTSDPWSFEGSWRRNAIWELIFDSANETKKYQKNKTRDLLQYFTESKKKTVGCSKPHFWIYVRTDSGVKVASRAAPISDTEMNAATTGDT